MPHIRTVVQAGMTIEIWEGYSWNCGRRGLRREKRHRPTPEEQIGENRRQRERKIRLLFNNNFSPGDLYMTLSYKIRPDPEQMKKDMESFTRALRKKYRAEGEEARYLYVIEIGKRGARHVHIVLNDLPEGMGIKDLRELWKHGYIDIKPLDDSGDYSKLAAYFVKYIEKTNEVLGSGRKGYSPSRNLVMPKLERTILKRDRLPAEPVIPPKLRGKVYVQKDSFQYGISQITGYEYVKYRLVRYEPLEKRRKRALSVTRGSKREVRKKKQHKNDRDRMLHMGEEVKSCRKLTST